MIIPLQQQPPCPAVPNTTPYPQQPHYLVWPPANVLYPSGQLAPYPSQPAPYPGQSAPYLVPGQPAPYPTQSVTNPTGPHTTN